MEMIGIDVGGTKIAAARINNNTIAQTLIEPTNKEQPTEQIIQIVNKLKTEHTVGVGIGVPAIVDQQFVLDTVNIPIWKKEPLAHNIYEATDLHAYVANDANCFTAGAHHFGCAQDKKHVIGLIIGTGCGCGVILNGQLFAGAHGSMGEIGEIPFLDGNVEDYASGKFFARHNTSGKELFAKAQQGDQHAQELFNEYGKHVAQAIVTIINAYDPDVIVLGGSVAKSYTYFEQSLKSTVEQLISPHVFKHIDIRVEDNPNIAVLGAAALVSNAQR